MCGNMTTITVVVGCFTQFILLDIYRFDIVFTTFEMHLSVNGDNNIIWKYEVSVEPIIHTSTLIQTQLGSVSLDILMMYCLYKGPR